jgi:cytochrome P450
MPALASGPFYKDVLAEGDEIAGYYLPRGTRVGTNAAMYAVGRDEAFWGPTANLFMPERWLEANDTHMAHMQARVDLVFGHGQFVCMGKAIALMEIGKSVPEVSVHSQ